MKRSALLTLAVSLTLGYGTLAWADAATDKLVDELAGRAEVRTRPEAELKADYAKAVQYLVAEQLSSTDLGRQGKGHQDIERMAFEACKPGREASRAAVCAAMAASLKPETPAHARIWLLRILENTGREEVVDAVAALLGDTDAVVRQRARCALQNNPTPKAGEALLAALSKAKGTDLVGIINGLGFREQANAVTALAPRLGDADAAVVVAAAAALGQIGTADAADAIAKVVPMTASKAQVLDAWLKCAGSLAAHAELPKAVEIYKACFAPGMSLPIRAAALRGRVMIETGEGLTATIATGLDDKDEYLQTVAASLTGSLPAKAGSQLISSKKAALKPAVVAIMIRAMAERKDVLGAPLLVELAKGQEPTLQLAALDGLGDCGDGAVVVVLAEAAATLQGPSQQAARNSLERMSATNVDAAILAALPKAESKVKQEYCRALGVRRAVSAMPMLLDMAGKDADPAVRADAIKAVGSLGSIKDVDALLVILVSPKSDAEGKSAEDAISGVISRVHDADQRATPLLAAVDKAGKAKASILQLLGRTGSDKAVAVLRAAAKDADKGIQTAAIRAMGEWPNDGMADDLHALALASQDQTQQVLAIRGLTKALSYVNTRKPADVVKLYGDVLAIARPDERKGILSGLSNISTIDAFKLSAGQIEVAGVQNEAMSACVKIGRDIVGKYPQEVGPVAKKILDMAKDERIKRAAAEILDRIKK